MSTEVKKTQKEPRQRKKVEIADTYLGLVSKILTITAALSTVSFWAYSNYYVGSLELRTSEPVDGLTVKLYDEGGKESVYHTERIKLVPGKYKMVVEASDKQSATYPVEIAFNHLSVVSHTVQPRPAGKLGYDAQEGEEEIASSSGKNHKWWQFWRRN